MRVLPHDRGELAHRASLHQRRELEVEAPLLVHAREQPHREQRVAREVKEALRHADVADAEHLRPDPDKLHLDRIARAMGEDEDVVVVRRVAPPPALPLLVAPVTAARGAEHVPAHHAGADVLGRFLHDPRALVDLAPLLAVELAPGGQRYAPVVQPLPALAERVLLALVRAGDEFVCRDRDVTSELAHRSSW